MGLSFRHGLDRAGVVDGSRKRDLYIWKWGLVNRGSLVRWNGITEDGEWEFYLGG